MTAPNAQSLEGLIERLTRERDSLMTLIDDGGSLRLMRAARTFLKGSSNG